MYVLFFREREQGQVDFAAAIRAVPALELRTANPDELFNMHRRFLISSFGLFAMRPAACGLTAASVMLLLLKPLLTPSSSPTLVVRSFEHFTWAPPIRAARATAAALKRAMPWPDLPLLAFPFE